MKNAYLLIALLAVALLSLGAETSSCGGEGDDDDDDDSGGDDDDAGDDDAGDDDGGGDDDDVSGDLTWQDPPSEEWMAWEEAKEYCENLSFDSHDDWRLPTISELRSLILGCDATVTGGACGVTDGCLDSTCLNDACGGCDYLEGPGSAGAYWPEGMSGGISWYWSSSPVADRDYDAWLVYFDGGSVDTSYYYADYYYFSARCVRPKTS